MQNVDIAGFSAKGGGLLNLIAADFTPPSEVGS